MNYNDSINNKLEGVAEFFNKDIVKYVLFYAFLIICSSIEFVDYFKANKGLKYIFLVLTTIILLMIMIKKKLFPKNLKNINWLFIFLIIYSILSFSWCQVMYECVKNTFLLFMTTVIAIYIGMEYSKEELFKMLVQWFIAIVIINLILWAFRFPFIFDTIERRYAHIPIKGIFEHRNVLGLNMVFSITITLWYLLNNKISHKRTKIIYLINLIGSIILLFETKSMTSWVLLPLFIMLIFLTNNKKVSNLVIYGILPLISLVSYSIICKPSWFTKLLYTIGRNPTLTRRDVIWRGVLECIKIKPILGYGYTNLLTENPNALKFISKPYGGLPVNCHNGYLEILADFGILGALFILIGFIFLFSMIKKLNHTVVSSNRKYISYILSFLVFILLHRLVESSLIKHLSSTYILIIIFSNIVQKEWDKQKNKA